MFSSFSLKYLDDFISSSLGEEARVLLFIHVSVPAGGFGLQGTGMTFSSV